MNKVPNTASAKGSFFSINIMQSVKMYISKGSYDELYQNISSSSIDLCPLIMNLLKHDMQLEGLRNKGEVDYPISTNKL